MESVISRSSSAAPQAATSWCLVCQDGRQSEAATVPLKNFPRVGREPGVSVHILNPTVSTLPAEIGFDLLQGYLLGRPAVAGYYMNGEG